MEQIKKAILVTGGTSGIGLAISKEYLQDGFFVVINYCNGGSKIAITEKNLAELGFFVNKNFIFLKADISKRSQLNKALDKISPKIKKNLQLLINNAAILKRGNIRQLSEEEWIDTFKVNIMGIINCSRWFFENAGSARAIVNIGSIRGFPHVARTDNVAYSISKSTIPTLTAALAKSFGRKVRVNAILPGTIDTPQRQGISKRELFMYGERNSIIKRLGTTKEIASACYFLTEKATYMTGASVVLDGGYSINYIR